MPRAGRADSSFSVLVGLSVGSKPLARESPCLARTRTPPSPSPRSSTASNAPYIEELYARYEADPKAVDAEWQSFFQSLKDDARDVAENARGPSWRRPDWPPIERNEFVAALDGDWAEIGKAIGGKVKAQAQTKGVELATADVERATRDSIRALMLIRAYRARGHFHANLDPLGL